MEKTTEQDRVNLNRLEASIPVQTRANITDLANLTSYWEGEGYRVRTMSQLLSWSMSLLVDILEKNNLMKYKIETAAEANKYLELMRLYQPSMKAKGFKRVAAAVRFEGMREEGMNPAIEDPHSFSSIHNKHSMDNPPIIKKSQEEVVAEARRERILKAALEADERIQKERLAKELEAAKNSSICIGPEDTVVLSEAEINNMSTKEFIEYRRKIDADIVTRENAPLELSEEDKERLIVKE